ncbi:MAG: hypothetical protein WEA61_03490 [Anaerolineales bacterium]
MEFAFISNDIEVTIAIEYEILTNSGKISYLWIHTKALPGISDGFERVNDEYKEILGSLSISGISSGYGVPAQIALDMEIIEAEPGSADIFEIWLLYPQKWGNTEISGKCKSD